MQQHGIEPACPLATSGFADDDRPCDVVGALILCADGCSNRLYHRTGIMERFLQLHHQGLKPAATHSNRFNDGHAKRARQLLRIQLKPVPLGQVDHVQCDHRR